MSLTVSTRQGVFIEKRKNSFAIPQILSTFAPRSGLGGCSFSVLGFVLSAGDFPGKYFKINFAGSGIVLTFAVPNETGFLPARCRRGIEKRESAPRRASCLPGGAEKIEGPGATPARGSSYKEGKIIMSVTRKPVARPFAGRGAKAG